MKFKTTAGQLAKNFGGFARLKRRDRQVYRAGEIPADIVEAIAKSEPPAEAEAYNAEYDPKFGK